MNEQKTRELYCRHVGSIEAERAAGPEGAPFLVLDLYVYGTVGCSYATLGAAGGPLRHEVVLDATGPFPPFSAAVEAVARAAPALAPGAVVPHAIPDTPFTALLCLPLEAEGSFSLTENGAPPHAFRLAPLTTAEQTLAEREPGRVLDLLRNACAFTADPYRACLVDVPPLPPAARSEVALQRRQARAALVALQAQVLREHGPRAPTARSLGSFAELASFAQLPRRRRDEHRIPPGAHIALHAWVEAMIYKALSPYVRHPAPITYLFGEFIYVTFATHPDAVRLLDRALDPRNLPRPVLGDPGREGAEASRRVTEALAIAVARCHPGESEAALFTLGQTAIGTALSTFDPADEIPLENHVWATVLPVLYEDLTDLKPPAVRGMPKVFRHAAQSEMLLEYERDARPPLLRLQEIAARLATELVTAYAAGLRGQLPK